MTQFQTMLRLENHFGAKLWLNYSSGNSPPRSEVNKNRGSNNQQESEPTIFKFWTFIESWSREKAARRWRRRIEKSCTSYFFVLLLVAFKHSVSTAGRCGRSTSRSCFNDYGILRKKLILGTHAYFDRALSPFGGLESKISASNPKRTRKDANIHEKDNPSAYTKKKSLQRGHRNLNKVLVIQKLFHEAGRGNWKNGEEGEKLIIHERTLPNRFLSPPESESPKKNVSTLHRVFVCGCKVIFLCNRFPLDWAVSFCQQTEMERAFVMALEGNHIAITRHVNCAVDER